MRMKQETIKGGAIYKTRPYHNVRFYGKGILGIGSIDFPSTNPLYTHDTYTVYAFGGGAEYKAWKTLYVRGDYEYQMWQKFQGPNFLTPNGFTVGATYYLRGIHRHS